MGSSEQLSSLAHKKAVGGDVAPTAIQDMETYEWNPSRKSQNYLFDLLAARFFAGIFLVVRNTL